MKLYIKRVLLFVLLTISEKWPTVEALSCATLEVSECFFPCSVVLVVFVLLLLLCV